MTSILIFRTQGTPREEKLSEMWRPAGGQLAPFLFYYSIAISYSGCTFIVVIPVFMYVHTAALLVQDKWGSCMCVYV